MHVPGISRAKLRTRCFCLHKALKSTVFSSNQAAPSGQQLIDTLDDSNESAN